MSEMCMQFQHCMCKCMMLPASCCSGNLVTTSSDPRAVHAAGMGNSGIGIVAFVLAVEPVGPSWRGTCGILQVRIPKTCQRA